MAINAQNTVPRTNSRRTTAARTGRGIPPRAPARTIDVPVFASRLDAVGVAIDPLAAAAQTNSSPTVTAILMTLT